MAYPYEYWRSWRLSRRDCPPSVASGINWRLFLMCFEIAYGRYMLSFRTPWFQVRLSSGERDWMGGHRWYGIRVYWSHPKNWNLENGGFLFTKSDQYLSFELPEYMRNY